MGVLWFFLGVLEHLLAPPLRRPCLQLMSAAHQQVPQAAVDEGHMWIKSFSLLICRNGASAKYKF